ncbi:MAG: thiamine pyrophosphate-binding protein [Rhodospirillales bacterium]|nr:thiamine pyrophosphate-binding protein [Rhodospirillales bacterium]
MSTVKPQGAAALGAPQWPGDIFRELVDLGVRQVAYVPDAGHSRLLDLCTGEASMTMVPLTTEEEGMALLAGAWLGGQCGVLLMQSSGVGNCLNMLSLVRTCRFPLLVLITMRGQEGEANPWQLPMGRITGDLLRLQEVFVHAVDDGARLGGVVGAAGKAVFAGSAAAAVLIAQSLVGVKTFED